MYLVELWVLLNTQYKKHHYNGRRLTHLQRQFPYKIYNVNETEFLHQVPDKRT